MPQRSTGGPCTGWTTARAQASPRVVPTPPVDTCLILARGRLRNAGRTIAPYTSRTYFDGPTGGPRQTIRKVVAAGLFLSCGRRPTPPGRCAVWPPGPGGSHRRAPTATFRPRTPWWRPSTWICSATLPLHVDVNETTKSRVSATMHDMALVAPTNPRCNVEIGKHLSHRDLLDHHHAVIYAVGSSTSRDLGISGEDLPGSHPASDFDGWYNGHPDHAGAPVRSDRPAGGHHRKRQRRPRRRADAVDGPPGRAARHRHRRACAGGVVAQLDRGGGDPRPPGPRNAAFSVGEFLALGHLANVDVVIDDPPGLDAELAPDPGDDIETATKLEIAREYARRVPRPGNKRIAFRFHHTPRPLSRAPMPSRVCGSTAPR